MQGCSRGVESTKKAVCLIGKGTQDAASPATSRGQIRRATVLTEVIGVGNLPSLSKGRKATAVRAGLEVRKSAQGNLAGAIAPEDVAVMAA